MRLISHFRIALCACAFAAATCSAHLPAESPAPITLVEPAAPLLPQHFGTWQQIAGETGKTPTGDATTTSILTEDGLARSSAVTYRQEKGAGSIDLQAWQFGDTTGAFSAFTFLRTEGYRAVFDLKLGNSAAQKGDSVLIWNGPSVVLATFTGGRYVADLSSLVPMLPKVGGPKGFAPLLPTMLPTKDLEADTLKYALGSSGYEAMGGVLPAAIVGFDKSAEVATAKYSGRGVLTLLLYPTPQIAGEHGRQIETEMNRDGARFGTVRLRREGPLVLLTTGSWPTGEAQSLIENIHLNMQLTYDKPMPPEFHAEVRKTASLLVSIAELSSALMLAAVVMGLFFGGGRAAIRVLQGKPAATEPEFLSIDLRGSSGDRGRGSFKPLH